MCKPADSNLAAIREIKDAVDAIAQGETIRFSWLGEQIEAGVDDSENLLHGIRYILGGGQWKVVNGSIK